MSSVLKRKLFMQPPVKKASGGIMAIVEDSDEEEDSYEDRTPENMEILSNNLRGDVRSMDERYDELAQMVGEEQAAQTPPEVLALLQTKLAPQQPMPPVPASKANGIAGLMGGGEQAEQPPMPGQPPMGGPQPPMPGQPPMPPQGAEPPMPPQGAEPPMPAPVQRQAGSPPMGEVSPDAASDFVESFVSEGGDLEDLAQYLAQPEGDFEQSNSLIENYLQNLSSQQSSSTGASGIESLVNEPQSPTIPVEDSLTDTAAGSSAALAINSLLGKTGSQQPVQRQAGSPPVGERVDPTITKIENYVDQRPGVLRPNDPFNLSGRGVQPMPPVPEAYVSMPKSRPLTPAELNELVTQKERKAMSPATRTLYELSRQMGVDPVILTDRLSKLSNTMKKIPGIGKLFKGMEAFESLSTGKKAAATVGAGGASFAAGLALSDRVKPNDGVIPNLSDQFSFKATAFDKYGTPVSTEAVPQESGLDKPRDSVSAIPNEYTADGGPLKWSHSATPPSPPSPSTSPDDPSAIGGPIDLKPLTRETIGPVDEVTPVDTFGYDESILKEQQAAEQYAPGAERDTSGPALEAAAAKEEDDAYATAIRKRAKVYQDLLGDSKEDRQMKAYLLLAEAGLKMMTGKGRNTAEIIAGGLQGLPSGLGAIASESGKIKRAATAAAISDINAQKLQETKSAASLAVAMTRQQASQLPRNQKIQGNLTALTQYYDFPTEGAGAQVTMDVATGLVDGTYKTDERGNLRGPTGEVVPRFGYGPANQPLKESDAGYIPDNNPFIQNNPPKPSPAVSEKAMNEVDDEIYKLQKTLGYIQAAKRELGNVVGPINVIQRGISSVTQPILGDLGPFTAFQASRGNVVDRANRAIQEAVALNTNRVSVYEQEKNRKLEIDKNSFFNSPQIELGRILRFETELYNEINKLKYRLNPEGGIKQMNVPNLGTKDDPLDTKAFSALGEYFQSQPNSKVYWRDQNGKTHALTKQQYETGMKTQ